MLPDEDITHDGIGFATKAWKEWDGFLNLPKRLKKYGLDSPALEIFPFRDDATLVWNAMHEWIQNYVDVYYETDADVVADTEIGSFMKAVVAGLGQASPAVLEEYAKASHSKTALVEFLLSFIFQVSVGHAAANFTQYEHYGFPPFQPSNMQKPPPTRKGECTTEREFVDALPKPLRATLVAGIVNVLSTYSD